MLLCCVVLAVALLLYCYWRWRLMKTALVPPFDNRAVQNAALSTISGGAVVGLSATEAFNQIDSRSSSQPPPTFVLETVGNHTCGLVEET